MTSRARINEIDLLRFIAAISVVFFHYAFKGNAADAMSDLPYPLLAPLAKYGYLGVDLFFMISGFVILLSAASGSLRDFAISRVVRLYPAFWVCCTLTFLMTMAIGGTRYTASVGQYLINMTMLSGFTGTPSIDGVYWSLFVELRFYALVGVALLLGRIHQAQYFVLAWLLVTVALTIFPNGKLDQLFIAVYAPYFIAGALCYLIWERGPSAARLSMLAISWALALWRSLQDVKAFNAHEQTTLNFPAVASIVTGFFAVMMLVALRRTGPFGQRRWLLAGALTYPLYLVHQNIGFMLFNELHPVMNPHLLFWGVLALVLGAAYLVHIGIERPLSKPMKALLAKVAGRLPGFKLRPSRGI